MVDVPSEGGHGLILWVHYRVLQDVHRVSNVGRKQSFCPSGHPVGLGQESPGQELLVRGHLPVYYVFRQDMFAADVRVKGTLRSLFLIDCLVEFPFGASRPCLPAIFQSDPCCRSELSILNLFLGKFQLLIPSSSKFLSLQPEQISGFVTPMESATKRRVSKYSDFVPPPLPVSPP